MKIDTQSIQNHPLSWFVEELQFRIRVAFQIFFYFKKCSLEAVDALRAVGYLALTPPRTLTLIL